MADGRKNNGGHKTAGRKSKADELKASETGLQAIEETYGSVLNYWKHIANESKESFPHLRLIHEYIYGKAKETKDLNIKELPSVRIEEV